MMRLNIKTTDLDRQYSRNNQELRFLICHLIFMPFVETSELILRVHLY